MKNLADYIRSIPDFPKPGILFRDITTLIEDAEGFRRTIDELALQAEKFGPVDKIAAPEARGFIFGAPLALRLGTGLVLIRKKGKLPGKTVSAEYALEYGTDEIFIHEDSVQPGERVLVIDDLLATGGTIDGCCRLLEGQGAKIAAVGFVIELIDLGGREKLSGRNVFSLVPFPGH
ncbi:MAG: adenine phosphoribosyltransferase [Thermoguttaceae bacterium]|nr:adenine phosphoribosyltransferase [Thermoguttaceae bacterium]